MKISVCLNGLNMNLDIEPNEFLLDVLRRYGCLSVKRACDTSSCGGCTVLMDGTPILSCSMLAAKADGHNITTAEGMQQEIAEYAEFITAEGADQCGYCNPGFALTVMALKKEYSNPTAEQVEDYLSGNLCRCSGYVGQLRALKKYLGVKS